MFVIGNILPRSKGAAFYVGDYKMLVEILLPGSLSVRWGCMEMRGVEEGKERPFNKGILCEAGVWQRCPNVKRLIMNKTDLSHRLALDTQNRSTCMCLPKRNHTLPNTTALNFKNPNQSRLVSASLPKMST
jgi:hypothetical protein